MGPLARAGAGRAAALLLLMSVLVMLTSPASPALNTQLGTSKLIIGEVRDYIRTVTATGGVPQNLETVTTSTGPYTYTQGTTQYTMPACEDVCGGSLLPGGGIAPPSLSSDLIAQGYKACTTPCYYARTMLNAPATGDLFQSGIEADSLYGQGRLTEAPYGLYTINFVSQNFYMYTPPRGKKTPAQCTAAGLPVGCAYGPGDVNPLGMRKIDMSSGKHLPPPVLQYAPLQMEYDLLSKSILMIVTGYPASSPPLTPAPDLKPILSLIAINETTGAPVTPGDGGPSITGGPYFTVTFCKSCPYKPDPNLASQFSFLYDYTDVYSSSSTFDQVDQVFWTVLWNPNYANSKTLFGIRRVTNFNSLSTDPLNGKWNLSVDYSKIQYYAWPLELRSLSILEFSPVMTQQVTDSSTGLSKYQKYVSAANVKALYAVVSITEKAGPCAPSGLPGGMDYKCGRQLTQADVNSHNAVAAQTFRGTLTYSATAPVYCVCPSALVQLNINYQNAVATPSALMTLGNAALDSSGQPYKILKWLDANYAASDTFNSYAGLTAAQLAQEPTVSTAPFLRSFQAMQPSSTGSTADETPARMYFANYDMTGNSAAVPPLPPPRPSSAAQPLVPGTTSTVDTRTPYGIWEYTIGTDINKIDQMTSRLGLNHPPLFMFSEDQYSRIIQQEVATMYVVATSPQRTYLSSKLNGILASQLVCTVFPQTCAACKQKYQTQLESVIGRPITSDADYLSVWQKLYSSGAYTTVLWVLNPQQYDRAGNALPQTWSFKCPETCDAYTCDQCLALFNKPCKFYVTAGQSTSVTITAVTIFGTVSISRSDNFTASLQSPDFSGMANKASLPTAQYLLGPVFRLAYQVDAQGNPTGDKLVSSDIIAVGQLAPDAQVARWDYPNYHNLYVKPPGTPPHVWLKPNEVIDPNCAATTLIPEGRCYRFAVRPRIQGDAGGVYVLQFGADRGGSYTLTVGYRGTADPYDSAGNVNMGTGIMGSPFTVTVVAGAVDNRISEAVDVDANTHALSVGTVGVVGTFNLQPRDRFGNDITVQQSFVVEAAFRGAQYVLASTVNTSLPTAATVAKDANGNPTASYAQISSLTNSGLKQISYFLTARSRVDPTYKIYITVNNNPIAGPGGPNQTLAQSAAPPYVLTLRPAPTAGAQSFAVESKATDNGLGISSGVVAGFQATFSILARDRFGNGQGFPDKTSYADALAGGWVTDPFMVVVEDANGNCGVGVVGQTWTQSGDPWGVRNSRGDQGCYSPQQWDALVWTSTTQPQPPRVDVQFSATTTFIDGFYPVSYTVRKAGQATMTIYLCDATLLASTQRCGTQAAPGKPASSSQPNVFGTSLGPVPAGAPGVASWPYQVTVAPGPTSPAESFATGTAVDTFQAGSLGPSGVGQTFLVTVRDDYGNVKTNPEAGLLQSANMPQMTIKYELSCTTLVQNHPTKQCQGIYQRYVEGLLVSEVPLRLAGNTVYFQNTGLVTINSSTIYLGATDATKAGVFQTTLTTTLAGRFDISITLPKGIRGGTLQTTRYPIMGADGKPGRDIFTPLAGDLSQTPPLYPAPYPLVVTPAAFSGAFSEVFYFDPPTMSGCGTLPCRTSSNSVMYSSHMGLSHQFTTSTGTPVLPMTAAGVVGTAGTQGTFYVLIRDIYANAKTDYTTTDAFSQVSIKAFDPTTLSDVAMSASCTSTVPVSLTAVLGSSNQAQGVWSVSYCSTRALTYAITITNGATSQQELTRLAYNIATGGLVGTSNRFTLTINAGSPDAAQFSASGPGLRGASLANDPLVTNPTKGQIYVVARDQYGNRINAGLAASQDIASKLHLVLTRCSSNDPTTCDATTTTNSSPTAVVSTATFTIDVWSPVAGSPGQFTTVYTPNNVNSNNSYYVLIVIKYGTSDVNTSSIIGTGNANPTDVYTDAGVVLGFNANAGLTTFPKQVFALANDGNSPLSPTRSFVTSWNGANLFTSYAGSTCGQAQTLVVTPVSVDAYPISNTSSVGTIVVELYRGASVTATNPYVDGSGALLSASAINTIISGKTPDLTYSRTFDGLSGFPNATPTYITYDSSGHVQVAIPAKASLDDPSPGVAVEGFYAVRVQMRAYNVNNPLQTISNMPFGGLRFNPAATGELFTQVLHSPSVDPSTPYVDPSNFSTLAKTSLYTNFNVTANGSSSLVQGYQVAAGSLIEFLLKPRDNFNNQQVYTGLRGPDDLWAAVADAPASSPASTVKRTANNDGTYLLTIGQTGAGTYKIRFYTTSDPRNYSSNTRIQGAADNAGTIVRGLLGQPSPGPSAPDYYLNLRIVPGPGYVPNFTASWNQDKLSVGDVQDVTIMEFDQYGNQRPTVTVSNGSPVYLTIQFKYAPGGVLSADTSYNYAIAPGVSVPLPKGTLPGQVQDYTLGYVLTATSPAHVFYQVVGHGATVPSKTDILKAGGFEMFVTQGNQSLSGSPFFIQYQTRSDQAAFDITQSYAYGPGLTVSALATSLPNATDPPAGTVRKGDSTYFFVQLRDSYGNELTRRPSGVVDIRADIYEPSATTGAISGISQEVSCVEQLTNNIYTGLYKCTVTYCPCLATPCTVTCYTYMVVKITASGQGTLPSSNFQWYNQFSTPTPTVVAGSVASNRMLFSYPDTLGRTYPVVDGVVVYLRSGKASPADSYARDPTCNLETKSTPNCQTRIRGGYNWGNMTAGHHLNFEVVLRDKFRQPKTDLDTGTQVLARLYMLKDQFGSSVNIQPWLANSTAPVDATNQPVWSLVASPADATQKVYMRSVALAYPDSDGVMSIDKAAPLYEPGNGLKMDRAGIYALHVVFASGVAGASDYTELELAQGTIRASPYNISIAPGNSDPSSPPKSKTFTSTAAALAAASAATGASFRRSLMASWEATQGDPSHPRHGQLVPTRPEPPDYGLLAVGDGVVLIDSVDPHLDRVLRQAAMDRAARGGGAAPPTPLITGSRSLGGRRLMQTGSGSASAVTFSVAAGNVSQITVALQDNIGNAQSFSPLRPLDVVTVDVADVLLPNETPCYWKAPSRPGLPQQLDTAKSMPNCRLVYTGFNFASPDLCRTTPCPPDYSTTGLNLTQTNNVSSGVLTVTFTANQTLPAVYQKSYLLGITLNGTPLTGSPFSLTIVPGTVYGPSCEVTVWNLAAAAAAASATPAATTAALATPASSSTPASTALATPSSGTPAATPPRTSSAVLGTNFVAGNANQFVFQARDQYGNNQQTNAESTNFLAEMTLTRADSRGTQQVVRGCTSNDISAQACFSIVVGPYNADPAQLGRYAVTFNTLVSSGLDAQGVYQDFSLALRYCPDPRKCSSLQNFYNPLGALASGSYPALVVTVQPSDTYAAECIAYGPDLLDGGVVNAPATFVVEARDRYSNRRLTGGDRFEAIVYSPRSQLQLSVGVINTDGSTLSDLGNGLYEASLTPTDPGSYTVLVQLLRKATDTTSPLTSFGFIRGVPFVPQFRLVDGDINALASAVVDTAGNTLSALSTTAAGADQEVLVQAYTITTSNAALPKKNGGDKVVASLTVGAPGSAGTPTPLTVIDRADNPLPPSETSGRYSVVVPGTLVTVAQEYTLTIQACKAADPSVPIGQRACAAGTALTNIQGSPFIYLVTAGPMVADRSFVVELADPSLYINDGHGWQAGIVSTFTVQPRDRFDNNSTYDPLTSQDIGLQLTATITGLSTSTVWQRVDDQDPSVLQDGQYMVTTTFDGLYVFSFQAYTAQHVRVVVALDGVVLRNSGAVATVAPGPLDVSNCIVDRTIGTLAVGQPYSFVLIARDSFSNNLPNGGTDFLGTLSLTNPFTDPGIGDNPMLAQSAAQPDATNIPDPNGTGTISASQYSKNSTYTYTGTGLNDPSVTVHMNLHIQDLLNGKYLVSYMSEAAGPATLTLTAQTVNADGTSLTSSVCSSTAAAAWCGQFATIRGGAFQLTFTPLGPTADPNNMHSYIYSKFGLNQQVAAGSNAVMVIQAYDQYKNPVTDSGYQFTSTLTLNGSQQRRLLGTLSYVTCASPVNGECTAGVPDKHYTITYTPTLVGHYTLDVKRSGASLRTLNSDGTFSLLPIAPGPTSNGFVVIPGPLDPSTSTITHPVQYVVNKAHGGKPHLALYATAGVQQEFTINGYDAYSNRLTKGGEQPIVDVGLLFSGKVADNGDGTYVVTYTVFAANVYQLRVLINQLPVGLCEACRIPGTSVNVDGVTVSSALYDPTSTSFELHVNPSSPDPEVFQTIAGTYSLTAGVATNVDVQIYDDYQNLITPAIGPFACSASLLGNSTACAADPGGSVQFPAVSVQARLLRTVADPNNPGKTTLADAVPAVTGQRLTDGSFRVTYAITVAGTFDADFFGTYGSLIGKRFDSTQGTSASPSVCPTPTNANNPCPSASQSPQVLPSLLDLTKSSVTGTGLTSQGACRPVNQALTFTMTPEDRYGNYVVTLEDNLVTTAIEADTAATPLAGLVASAADSTQSEAGFLTTLFSAGATAAGSSDANGDTCAIETFPSAADQAAFVAATPYALLGYQRVKVTYTPRVSGRLTVSVLYQNAHLTGSPFNLTVSPADIGGTIATGASGNPLQSGVGAHAYACQSGNCSQLMAYAAATCATGGTCSLGDLANQMVGTTARYEIRPADVYSNRLLGSNIACTTLGATLAKCDGTQNTACPVRVRVTFTGASTLQRSSYGAAGTWYEDANAPAAERPSVRWSASDGTLVAEVPMVEATGDGTPNVTVYFSLHTPDDAKLVTADEGLAITNGWGKTYTVLSGDYTTITTGIGSSSSARGDGLAGALAGSQGAFTIYAVADICRTTAGALNAAITTSAACTTASGTWVQVPLPKTQTLTATMSSVDASVAAPSAPTVAQNTDATFSVTYTTQVVAQYVMVVSDASGARLPVFLGASPNQGTITVLAAAASLSASSVAVGATSFTAGSQAYLVVSLKDSYGNAVIGQAFQLQSNAVQAAVTFVKPESALGPTTLTTDLQSVLNASIITVDNRDSTYSILFNTRVAGTYSVAVYLLGPSTVDPATGQTLPKAFSDSPKTIAVTAAAPSAATSALLSSTGGDLSSAIAATEAGNPVQLLVRTYDQYSNPLSVGGYVSDILVTAETDTGGFKATVALTDAGDGTYTGSFTPPTIGTYLVKLFISDVLSQPNSANAYTASGTVTTVATSAAQTNATGTGVSGARVGVVASFTIVARDVNGKAKTTDDDCPSADKCAFKVTLTPSSPTNEYGISLQSYTLPVVNNLTQPGTYTVSYSVPAFGSFSLSVQLNGVEIQGSPFPVTVSKALAPLPTFVTFSDTATSLLVNFLAGDRSTEVATNRAGLIGLDDCSKIFTPATVGTFGLGAQCSFRNASELVVLLGFRATVKPGDYAELQSTFTPTAPGIINAALTSSRTQGTLRVVQPDNSPSPTVILRTPSYVSVCDDLLIDASGSYGGSGRSLRFVWGMLPNVPNEKAISDLLVSATAGGTTTSVTVPNALLAPDITYTFYVEVRNFLNTFTQKSVQVTRRSQPIPRLIFDGNAIVHTYRSQALYLPVTVTIPSTGAASCILDLQGATMTFQWAFDETQGVSATFPLDPATSTSRVLYIAPGTLTAGSVYYLKVTGSVQGRPELTSTTQAVVMVDFEPLIVVLDTPSLVTTLDALTLSTARSVDPNDPSPAGATPQAPFGPFLYTWQCNPVINGVPSTSRPCFDDTNGLLAPPPESTAVTLPPGTLSPGSYLFTATATKEPLVGADGAALNRTVSVSRTVTVEAPPPGLVTAPARRLADTPRGRLLKSFYGVGDSSREVLQTVDGLPAAQPIVTISPLATNVVNGNDKLVLTGNITVTYPNVALTDAQRAAYFASIYQATNFTWSVTAGVFDVTALGKAVLTSYQSPTLVVAPNQLAPGETYTFRLSANDTATGLAGADTVSFQVNGAPTSGTCAVSPTTGVAASTPFSLSCTGWEDALETALTYEFRYVDPTTNDAVPLVPMARANVADEIFVPPVTTDAARNLTLQAIVSGATGASTVVPIAAIVQPPVTAGVTYPLVCTAAESASPGCPCTLAAGAASCTVQYTGDPAFVLQLMDQELALRQATNTVPTLLTLAKSCAMILHRWVQGKQAAAVTALAQQSAGATLSPSDQALVDDYRSAQLLSGVVGKRLITAVYVAGQTVRLSQQDLDLLGDAMRDLFGDPATLDTATGANVVALAVARTGSVCIQLTGAQGVLDAMSSLDGAVHTQATSQVTASATRRRLAARRALLEGGESAREHSRRWLQESAQASQSMATQLTSNFQSQAQLFNALACNLSDGEPGYALATSNIQVAVQVKQDPSGDILPPPPGQTTAATARRSLLSRDLLQSNSTVPSFNVPAGTASPGVALNVVAKNNAINPYQFTSTAAGVTVASSVASLEFTNPQSASGPESVRLTPDQPSIRVRIPVTVSGSACRRTVGGCRYYNDTTGQWQTDGLFEVERTSTYIVCETKHLTSFAISADDALPQFNVVNPIGDADLLTRINLQNALVFYVLGITFAGFGVAIVVAWRQDRLDRAKARLEGQVSQLERRLVHPDKRAAASQARKTSLIGRIARLGRAEGGADAQSASRADEGVLAKVGAAIVAQQEVMAIMYARPSDHFTRPQRLVILLSLILAQIAVVAVFFGTNPSNLAAKAIIGLITAVALSPSKFAFRFLFQKASYIPRAAKPVKKARQGRRPKSRPVRWRIRVWTSDRRGAGTDATVSIHVYGLKSDYGPIVLPANRSGFERGQMDEFEMHFPSPGDISKISIGHDGTGLYAAWHLDRVELVNLETAEAWLFRCGKWLDTNPKHDGGLLVRSLELPERYVDEGVRQAREAEARAMEEAARMAAMGEADDKGDEAPTPPNEASLSAKPPTRHPGAQAQALGLRGAASGDYAEAVRAGSFATPSADASVPDRGSAQSDASVARAPPPPMGVPRPKRPPSLRRRPPPSAGSVVPTASTSSPPPPAAGSPMRPKRFKARAAALQALGFLRATLRGEGGGTRPAGRGKEGAGGRVLGEMAETLHAMAPADRHHRIRQLVGGAGRGGEEGVDATLVRAAKRIQRAWRRRMAVKRRQQSLAAARIQAAWRAKLARDRVREMLEERATGRTVDAGVWFVHAHRVRRTAQGSGAPAAGAQAPARPSRLAASPSDALVSKPVRTWVPDAPTVAAREGEEVQRRTLEMQARNAKMREQRRLQRRKQLRDRRLRRGLPRWFIWPTYLLCALFIALATWLIILYGLYFPPAIARAWLLSSFFSIFLELFVQDPLRVAVLAYLKARVEDARARAALGMNEEEVALPPLTDPTQKRGRARDRGARGQGAGKGQGSGAGGGAGAEGDRPSRVYPSAGPGNRVYPMS